MDLEIIRQLGGYGVIAALFAWVLKAVVAHFIKEIEGARIERQQLNVMIGNHLEHATAVQSEANALMNVTAQAMDRLNRTLTRFVDADCPRIPKNGASNK